MTDRFTITPLPQLLQIVLNQLDKTGSLFGIPQELFFKPNHNDPFRTKRFGQLLETPIGVAAGPHTQLSQNILAAWLTGARFIELKTVQTLDELDVSKPCIDMQDEGYNCEWSQELKIHESFNQYLDAWILIHVLKHEFGWDEADNAGVIFNMSVGYDYEGIQNDNIQWFFDRMKDASAEIAAKTESIKSIFPDATKLNISPCISNNVTLSTMHGCPPDEIEKIGRYLIEEKKLHTAIKLNPTLLGRDELHNILTDAAFETSVPDEAFEHDLKFGDAVKIIKNLQNYAETNRVQFSLKLTNTLESENHKDVFPANEKMMYMSGRALHPISINLAKKLQETFDGKLDISFCAGVDTFNVVDTISCDLYPVTVCSDILKPGGYGRLNQYLEELNSVVNNYQAKSIDEFIKKKAKNLRQPALSNLRNYAKLVLTKDRYKKTDFLDPDIKTKRALGHFDCIDAPCVDTCPTHQDIPDYLSHTSNKEIDKAYQVIMKTNPFPRMTGMVCDHLCQTKCTRINYDNPVLIRDVKRFIAENAEINGHYQVNQKNVKAAIIGAGPSGLSCAYFLAREGFSVNIYETKPQAGGMVSGAIPSFRLTKEAIVADVEKIEKLGVKIRYNFSIDESVFKKFQEENDFIYIATGAQRAVELSIDGTDSKGVLDSLRFLLKAKAGKPTGIGKNVAIIGGGNTAMDAARTAYRLFGENGKVMIIYRRTKKQMPADIGEIKAVLDEGMEIFELTAPLRINTINGEVSSISCYKMKLGGKDESGRPKPIKIPDSEFDFKCDTIIPAIGQELDIDFTSSKFLKTKTGSYETQIENVFIGGDAMRGASTAINAIGDGRKAATEIIEKASGQRQNGKDIKRPKTNFNQHMVQRSRRKYGIEPYEISLSDRKNFKLVSTTLSEEEAVEEASRCLLCDEICNICVTVCPNLAFHSYQTLTEEIKLQKIKYVDGKYLIDEDKPFCINQEYQILHITDWCNECGNCTTFCPTIDAPYKNKPHLYISREAFDKEKDGYYFEFKNGDQVIHHQKGQYHSVLTKSSNGYEFKNATNKLQLDENFSIVDFKIPEKNNFDLNLREAAEMKIIMQGAASFYG